MVLSPVIYSKYISSTSPRKPFGLTTIVPGFGFLRDFFPKPFLIKWSIDSGFAVSADLPGVHLPCGPFMGVMGVAPSHTLRARLAARENELLRQGGAVLLHSAQGAIPAEEPMASEALRTIPPRETGGKFDIKQLKAGSTLLLPVYVPGALFSAGDGHFAQGDGESCGTAVEMGATLTVRFGLRKGLEAQDALLNMIDHLVAERGYSREQAYVLTSVAVDLRISQLVDVPNVVVSAFLPLDIFPKSTGR
jgi:formamidase